MKRMFLVLCLLVVASSVYAKGKRSDYTFAVRRSSVSISSSTWTAIPVVNSRRIAIKIDLLSGTTNHILLLWSSASTAPTDTTSFGDKMKEADPPWILPINKNVFLYGIASGDGTETLIYQDLMGEY